MFSNRHPTNVTGAAFPSTVTAPDLTPILFLKTVLVILQHAKKEGSVVVDP